MALGLQLGRGVGLGRSEFTLGPVFNCYLLGCLGPGPRAAGPLTKDGGALSAQGQGRGQPGGEQTTPGRAVTGPGRPAHREVAQRLALAPPGPGETSEPCMALLLGFEGVGTLGATPTGGGPAAFCSGGGS